MEGRGTGTDARVRKSNGGCQREQARQQLHAARLRSGRQRTVTFAAPRCTEARRSAQQPGHRSAQAASGDISTYINIIHLQHVLL